MYENILFFEIFVVLLFYPIFGKGIYLEVIYFVVYHKLVMLALYFWITSNIIILIIAFPKAY